MRFMFEQLFGGNGKDKAEMEQERCWHHAIGLIENVRLRSLVLEYAETETNDPRKQDVISQLCFFFVK